MGEGLDWARHVAEYAVEVEGDAEGAAVGFVGSCQVGYRELGRFAVGRERVHMNGRLKMVLVST